MYPIYATEAEEPKMRVMFFSLVVNYIYVYLSLCDGYRIYFWAEGGGGALALVSTLISSKV